MKNKKTTTNQLEIEVKRYHRTTIISTLDESREHLVKIKDLIKQEEERLKKEYHRLSVIKSEVARLTRNKLIKTLEEEERVSWHG